MDVLNATIENIQIVSKDEDLESQTIQNSPLVEKNALSKSSNQQSTIWAGIFEQHKLCSTHRNRYGALSHQMCTKTNKSAQALYHLGSLGNSASSQ